MDAYDPGGRRRDDFRPQRPEFPFDGDAFYAPRRQTGEGQIVYGLLELLALLVRGLTALAGDLLDLALAAWRRRGDRR